LGGRVTISFIAGEALLIAEKGRGVSCRRGYRASPIMARTSPFRTGDSIWKLFALIMKNMKVSAVNMPTIAIDHVSTEPNNKVASITINKRLPSIIIGFHYLKGSVLPGEDPSDIPLHRDRLVL
jgi:hypothetical protein